MLPFMTEEKVQTISLIVRNALFLFFFFPNYYLLCYLRRIYVLFLSTLSILSIVNFCTHKHAAFDIIYLRLPPYLHLESEANFLIFILTLFSCL